MPNLKLKIAYDGTDYYGWQKTLAGPSIESTLTAVLEQVLRHPVTLQAASRTDLGVHAEGQVVNFITDRNCDLDILEYSCNSLLPKSMRILSSGFASDHFHATLDTTGKKYEYTICNTPVQLPQGRLYSWHVAKPLDLLAMRGAAASLIGERNFQAFCNVRKNMMYESHIRRVSDIRLTVLPEGLLQITVEGNHFLYKMVRNIVGTLVDVGLGKLEAGSIPEILQSQSRPKAGITAPAHGLCLKEVFY